MIVQEFDRSFPLLRGGTRMGEGKIRMIDLDSSTPPTDSKMAISPPTVGKSTFSSNQINRMLNPVKQSVKQ